MNDTINLRAIAETFGDSEKFLKKLKDTALSFSGNAGKWRIDATVSRFLVADGSLWSLPLGEWLFRELADGREIIRRDDDDMPDDAFHWSVTDERRNQ